MKKRIFLTLLFVVFSASSVLCTEGVSVDGALFGGTSLLDFKGESFGLKVVPVGGISLMSNFQTQGTLFYGLELSCLYSFRSNYNNYYYYDSYLSLSLMPRLGVSLKGRSLTYSFLVGVGGSHAFSGLFGKTYWIVSAGAGVYFPRFFPDGILLSYSHSVVTNYPVFETIKVQAVVHIWQKKVNRKGEDL
ncbi:MAG: hypothetical protein AMS17_00030 [Spirochaetes bacterium DG_61]|jgi:hypothetical protein|nr:MAG: hypothetical protein AMS17_00030 [Spirochaetes bacterium DG_61]